MNAALMDRAKAIYSIIPLPPVSIPDACGKQTSSLGSRQVMLRLNKPSGSFFLCVNFSAFTITLGYPHEGVSLQASQYEKGSPKIKGFRSRF